MGLVWLSIGAGLVDKLAGLVDSAGLVGSRAGLVDGDKAGSVFEVAAADGAAAAADDDKAGRVCCAPRQRPR